MTSIPKWTIDQLNIFDLGNTIQVSGVIYSDSEVVYLCMMPNEPLEEKAVRALDLSQEDWKKLVKQTDVMETEVLAKAADGKLAKIIVRKSTRQIEQGISWAVFRRDGYKCRYCGNDRVPLTVDHLIVWEEGGPSTEENLVAACRRCNKARGNTPYAEWIDSPRYKKTSQNVDQEIQYRNRNLVGVLPNIELRHHTRGR